jgi:TonB family protein
LFASLRSGGLTTRTLEAQLDPDSRERLVQRVYSLSRYPREALDAESEGTVTVRFRVDRDGNACDIVALPAEQDLHPSLAEEAVRMVEQGAPYPLPTVRSEVDLFVAVAWRNSLGDRGDRIVVVVPSGDRAVDEKARSLAAADARRETALGWHLSAWSVKAVADAPMGGPGAVRLVSFGGDERLRPALEEVVAARLVNASKTGYLRIPIHFRIQPN